MGRPQTLPDRRGPYHDKDPRTVLLGLWRVEQMAHAAADGARSVGGIEVTLKRVPELVPEKITRKVGMKLDRKTPIASPAELANYDAIIFGTPTRLPVSTARLYITGWSSSYCPTRSLHERTFPGSKRCVDSASVAPE
jgi:hypothetical protein